MNVIFFNYQIFKSLNNIGLSAGMHGVLGEIDRLRSHHNVSIFGWKGEIEKDLHSHGKYLTRNDGLLF